MSEPFAEILRETDELTDRCRRLIESEMAQLRGGEGVLESSFYEGKRELIGQLEGNVERLRTYRENLEEQPVQYKSQLDHLQQKFLQVLRLDRELEKMLLSGGNRWGKAVRDSDTAGGESGGARPASNPINRAYFGKK